MIETTVLDYLRSVLDVPVYMEKPDKEPTQYVLIEKTSSSVENCIKSATFALQSYADTMYSAALLNEKVKAAMNDIVYNADVSRSALNTDYNFTDTTKKKYRYQAIYDLYY